jgi:hypothetical protein
VELCSDLIEEETRLHDAIVAVSEEDEVKVFLWSARKTKQSSVGGLCRWWSCL